MLVVMEMHRDKGPVYAPAEKKRERKEGDEEREKTVSESQI
jgi:hypothetical protein